MAILASTERARLATLTSVERSIPGIAFSGTNQYFTRGAGLTGAADAAVGIFSCFLKVDGSTGAIQVITLDAGNDTQIFIDDITYVVNFVLRDASNAVKVKIVSSVGLVPGVNHNILASWNTAVGAGGTFLYIDDKNVKTDQTHAAGDIDYTQTNWGIGASPAGTFDFKGVFGPLYLNTAETMDFSVEANRRKFVTAANSPAQFGADGSTPTGNQPIIYFDGKTVDGTNLGSGGNFSATGTPTAGFVKKKKRTMVIPNGCHV